VRGGFSFFVFCLSSLCILSLPLPMSLVLFVFTLYLDPTIDSVPCFVCLHSVSSSYYCQCLLFCLSSLCILSLLLPVSLVLFVFTVSWVYYCQCSLFCLSSLYLESTIASVPCFVCLHSVSWSYYCRCSLFCLSSLCILSLLLPVSLVLFVFTLYLNPTIASVLCFVCLPSVSWAYYCQCPLFCLSLLCILILLLPVSLVLFVFPLYLELTIASVPCFVCLPSVSWAYYCQCSLFCLSSLCILSLLLPVSLVLFVFTASWVYYCQCSLFCLSSLCILSLLLSVFLVLFVFTLYRDPTIAGVPCFVCLHSVSWVYYCQCPLCLHSVS
jgi:hypothetical protein